MLPLDVFDARLDRLFAFGIDPVDGGLPTDQPSDWPSVEEVQDYVRQVRAAIDDGIDRLDTTRAGDFEFPPSQLLSVAVEHRLMHAETLAYMFHQLPFSKKLGALWSGAAFPQCVSGNVSNPRPGGDTRISSKSPRSAGHQFEGATG